MEVRTTIEGNKAIIELVGKLTVNALPDLEAALDALPPAVRDLDIVVTAVDYVSSAGLRVIVRASKLIMGRGGELRLMHPCDTVWEVLEIAGFTDVFTVVR